MSGGDSPDYQTPLVDAVPLYEEQLVPLYAGDNTLGTYDCSTYAAVQIVIISAAAPVRVAPLWLYHLNADYGFSGEPWDIDKTWHWDWAFPVRGAYLRPSLITVGAQTIDAIAIYGLRYAPQATAMQRPALLVGGWGVTINPGAFIQASLPPYAGPARVTVASDTLAILNLYIQSRDFAANSLGACYSLHESTQGRTEGLALPPAINALVLQNVSATSNIYYYSVVAG